MPSKPKTGRAYRVLVHTSIPKDPDGDPNDSIELRPGRVVDASAIPDRINIAHHVRKGEWEVADEEPKRG